MLRRRLITIPGFISAWAIAVTLSPLLFLAAVARDASHRRRWATVRALLMLYVYLSCEVAGIAASMWLWATARRDSSRYRDRHFNLQIWWASTLLRSAARIYGLRVLVEGDGDAVPGPIILLARHVSPLDNLIPAVFISGKFGLRLRWAINTDLLRDPSLDIVGHRLQNAFVQPRSDDSEGAVQRVAALADGLGPHDGVCIFPEGALFRPDRRVRILERIRASGDEHLAARAARLQHVLPPRLGGVLALLDRAPGTDVVICAHVGLEPVMTYRNFLNGRLVGGELLVTFWRVPASEIPHQRAARIDWLFDQWERVDAWVAERLPSED